METENQKLERCFKASLYEIIGMLAGFIGMWLTLHGVMSPSIIIIGLVLQIYGCYLICRKS